MSTRSRIALLQDDGKIKSVYCHSDGAPSYTGKTLLKNYNNKLDVECLLEMGDMSSLAHNIESSHFYGRDEDEANVDARVEDMAEFIKNLADGNYGDYTYLFRDGEWICFVGTSTKGIPIEKAIK
ncbi:MULTISPECIES: hypothetical protein [unclassified Aliiroseovarius]|uniref:hypothetical protein n=1 Tax=unclassified Aliiroseovarius TaxID=2623558 RepID=UPI0015697CC2|nr:MULTISPECIES: hypothetical protein [unclassified Aliiroseovarius]NRP28789.1 hypothetical protein [Aliiroseovarius sp. xm-m-314]NRP78431.1 hypothetical protein [Aliiroseovarius sp. xm-v-209]